MDAGLIQISTVACMMLLLMIAATYLGCARLQLSTAHTTFCCCLASLRRQHLWHPAVCVELCQSILNRFAPQTEESVRRQSAALG